jgi:hypothetical protein
MVLKSSLYFSDDDLFQPAFLLDMLHMAYLSQNTHWLVFKHVRPLEDSVDSSTHVGFSN